MKKKAKKSVLLGMSSVVLAASLSFSSNAFAASSASGSVAGYSTYGSVYMGSNSASAMTTCGTMAGLFVTVSYTYYHDNFISDTVTSSNSSPSTSVSTTANAGWVSVQSRWADGTHNVYYQSQSWSASTHTP